MTAQLNAVYRERNHLAAALARVYPSGIKKTAIEGWDAEWHNCVYIDSPMGQLSWHYHDSDADLFQGLPEYSGSWDGHTTEEKYDRLTRLILNHDRLARQGQIRSVGIAAVERALEQNAVNRWPGPRGHERSLPSTYTDWLAGIDSDGIADGGGE